MSNTDLSIYGKRNLNEELPRRKRMSEEIFYQWQNEHLLRTIYPLREMKLRDFLIHYQEIDAWEEYKDKTIESISDEVC